MSAILAVFNNEPRPVDDGLVKRMLDRMQSRGSGRSALWSTEGAVLSVARNEWEFGDDFAGNVLVVDEGDLVVAGDASIYYRDDLRGALRASDVRIGGTTASHLILAAYRAWGDQCARHLEGDYAFIVYDRRRGRVFCARDFSGKRPLYYADLGHTLIVGSTTSAVTAHPECPQGLNIAHLAEAAGALWQSAHETAYEAVYLLPAGSSLCWTHARRAHTQQDWYAPESEPASGPAFDDAAVELRDLLQRAVDERLASTGVTAIWMSGGWDSTAVFGAGQRAVQHRGPSQVLLPVSITFPPGDPGREDELINAVADRSHVPVHWLSIGDAPLLDRPAERAAARDEPVGHAYENLTRALARGCREVGSHIAFDGNGGDQLFQVSPVFLADLLRAGRWVAFAKEWRALKLGGFRDFFSWGLKPWLPPSLFDAATIVRGGRRLHRSYERWLPPWMHQRLAKTLRERQSLHVPVRAGRSCSAYETHSYLSSPDYPRTFGLMSGLTLEEGVELRSPLYDQRIIEFAARRPRRERSSAGETKRLLRRAMRDLLPEHVLAPRRTRTGILSAYFASQTRQRYPSLLRTTGDPWMLAELGIVEPAALARGRDEYLRNLDPDIGLALLCTLQAELWVRAQLRSSEPPGDVIDGHAALASPEAVGRGWGVDA